MKYLCLVALLLVGCGQAPAPTLSASVDTAIKPYFDRFTQTIGVSSDGINAEFADLTYPTIGLCTLYSDGTKKIQIDNKFWDNASDNEKEQTVFHELGHCSMGLQHINTMNADYCPTSIMNMFAFGGTKCYRNNKAAYFTELESHK